MSHASFPRAKRCPKCDTTKDLSDFGRDASRPDGRYSYCKACRRAPSRAEQEIEQAASKGLKKCTLCLKTKPFCAFDSDSTKRFGVTSRCKRCHKEQRALKAQEYHARLSDVATLRDQGLNRCYKCKQTKSFSLFLKSRKSSFGVQNLCLECNNFIRRRYNRLRNRAERDYVRWEVFEADDFICYLCEDVLDPELFSPHPKSLTIDHVVPVSRGGADSRDNVRTACLDCNRRKNDMLPEEFLARAD